MTHKVLVDALVATTGLGVIVWVANVIARRSSAALRHTLWRIALAGFWLVPVVLVTANVLDLNAYAIRVPVLSAAEVTQSTEAIEPQDSGPLAPAAPSSAAAASHETRPPQAVTPGHMDVARWLLLLWVVGAAFGGACFVRNMYSVRRLLSQRSPADDPILTARVGHWTAKIGLQNVPALAESETVVVPTVAGWRAPLILLPSGFSASDAGSDAIIVHELAHVHRGDVATVWLSRLTQALWWWHPLVWLIAHKLRGSAEEACDNWAIALTERRKAYAGVLVHWAEVGASASNLACAYQGKALIRRVKRILTERRIPMLQLSGPMKAVLAVCAFCAIVAAGTLRIAPTQAQSSGVTAQTEAVNTVTIRGQIVGPDAQPVPDCRVLAFYYTPHANWETVETASDAAGAFSFTIDVSDAVASVSVVAAKEPLALDWASSGEGEEVTLRLGDSPITCIGNVVDSEGKPVVGAEVWVRTLMCPAEGGHSARSLHLREKSFLSDTTDEEGRFQISGIPPEAKVGLTVAAEGLAQLTSYRQPITTRGLRFLMVSESTISGQITHNRQPVAGVKVHCRGELPDSAHAEAVSAVDGTYQLEQLRRGFYRITVEPPEGITAKPIERIRVGVGEHITGVDVELSPGGLVQGRVTEAETGRPIPYLRMGAQELFRDVTTDESGAYSMRLPAGKAKVICAAAGGPVMEWEGDRWREVEVVEGQTLTGVDFGLRERQPEVLRGQVLSPDGQPAPGVQLAVLGGYWGPPTGGPFKAITDAEGRFELEKGHAPPDDLHSLRVLAHDVDRGLAGLATVIDPEEPMEVRLAQGAYVLTEVVDTEGKPVAGVTGRVLVSARRAGGGHTLVDLPVHVRSDDQGQVRIGPLPPGVPLTVGPGMATRLLVVDDTWRQVGEITLAPGQKRELPALRVNLEGRSWPGWVGDQDWGPIEGAIVFGVGEEQYHEFGEPVYADERGYFLLTGLPMQGKVTIVAVHPTKPLFASHKVDPDSRFPRALILRPTGSTIGQVLDKQGQPVSDVYVDVSGWLAGHWIPEELRLRLGAAGFTTETYTDYEGKWSFQGLVPGIEYSVSLPLLAGDYVSGEAPTEFTAKSDEAVDVGVLVLKEQNY